MMKININGGDPLYLKDFKSVTWTNVDITAKVRASDPLNDEMYHGIGPNIYLIQITPYTRQTAATQECFTQARGCRSPET
jgi:hypothetical protein